MTDLSQLTDEDRLALQQRDLARMSTAGLLALRGVALPGDRRLPVPPDDSQGSGPEVAAADTEATDLADERRSGLVTGLRRLTAPDGNRVAESSYGRLLGAAIAAGLGMQGKVPQKRGSGEGGNQMAELVRGPGMPSPVRNGLPPEPPAPDNPKVGGYLPSLRPATPVQNGQAIDTSQPANNPEVGASSTTTAPQPPAREYSPSSTFGRSTWIDAYPLPDEIGSADGDVSAGRGLGARPNKPRRFSRPIEYIDALDANRKEGLTLGMDLGFAQARAEYANYKNNGVSAEEVQAAGQALVKAQRASHAWNRSRAQLLEKIEQDGGGLQPDEEDELAKSRALDNWKAVNRLRSRR